jgi:hypothetical protein
MVFVVDRGTGTCISESLSFPLSVSFDFCSIFTHVSWGMDSGPVSGPVPQRHSLTPSQ